MRKYTNQQLLDIAKKHIDHFTSAEKWNQYAKEKQLPNVTCYKRFSACGIQLKSY